MSDATNNQSSKEDSKSQTVDAGALLKELDNKLTEFTKKVDSKLEGLKSQPAMPQSAPASEDVDDVETLLYTDPKKAVEKITKSVEAKLENRLSSEQRIQQQFGDTYNKLAQDYPEITKQDSKFHQRARELVAELSDGRAYDSAALERAVYRAANELGVMPLKHRKAAESSEDDDSYVGGGSNMSSGSKRKSKEGGLDPRTIAFAQALGQNINDPEYIKRLEEINKSRKGNWKAFK